MNNTPSFSLLYNLDDENEVLDFLSLFGNSSARKIAHSLGYKGKGSMKAAQSLLNYAWNKKTAITERRRGNTNTAMKYESICDSIYKELPEELRW